MPTVCAQESDVAAVEAMVVVPAAVAPAAVPAPAPADPAAPAPANHEPAPMVMAVMIRDKTIFAAAVMPWLAKRPESWRSVT
ncbi:hypothetical protein [Candidatus Odyssella thessalonicensis]|uniref:hypothetical protein n=1 Tax=Candidatus Odyssella thessalonicensis TaxID=84647 RepID=UPI0015847065|nr:hypothetical protein [Candidatus Odyssella thessalonicensis]